ncbi:MAG: hypothetical protein M1335_00425, partial [Chloroflexi bacterium]|nr:hypothetical protein [Chloroflexota bacterium]
FSKSRSARKRPLKPRGPNRRFGRSGLEYLGVMFRSNKVRFAAALVVVGLEARLPLGKPLAS